MAAVVKCMAIREVLGSVKQYSCPNTKKEEEKASGWVRNFASAAFYTRPNLFVTTAEKGDDAKRVMHGLL